MRLRGVLCGLLCGIVGVASAVAADAKLDGWLAARLEGGGRDRLLVVMRDQGPGPELDLPPAVLHARLVATADAAQAPLLDWLATRGIAARRFYIVNALLIEGDLGLARAIAARSDVARIVGDPLVRGLDEELGPRLPLAPAGVEWGVTMVRAPDVWAEGPHGEGVVVASCDTGVEWDHPALLAHYRGYDAAGGTVDHSWSWHDAIDDSSAPWDDNDHGTHTSGTMVGDDGQGNQVGVAPGARFIACRNMDHGNGRPSTYLDCLEWTLAPYPPGGDPLRDGRPELAPQVVNNSWGCPTSEGCDWATLRAAFARQRQAGIWQVAAAGNSGSSCSTVTDPPSIYDAAFTVGAVDASRALAYFSSRGPVTVDGSNRLKPNVSAPGDGVRSCIPGGGYTTMSGTSMASPHTAGVAALLWSALPSLRGLVNISRCVLQNAASHQVSDPVPQSCGGTSRTTFPNDMTGWGLVDAYAALHLPDNDGDTVANPCDCAPANGGVFAAPVEVAQLAFAGASRSAMAWASQAASAGSATKYDLARGDVAALLASGSTSAATCLVRGLLTASGSDESVPSAGSGFYYLVRARNNCGIATWGTATSGAARQLAACD